MDARPDSQESGLCLFMPIRCCVYVDGFNLYYGALKGTAYKWLNIRDLCERLAPHDFVVGTVKYFTAQIIPRPGDPDQGVRQQMLFRALRTVPDFEIILGKFYSHPKWMRLVNPAPGVSPYVNVIKTEEKGSDVNLATHLLVDGFKDKYDAAMVITNDTDLLEPIRVVRNELGKKVGLLSPYPKANHTLRMAVNFVKPIRDGALRAAQFPNTLSDSTGPIVKPASW